MADSFSDIMKKYEDMSVTELGTSLLERKADIQEQQAKRDRKDRRIQQALAVLLAGQGLFKNAFKRRQAELKNAQTLELLNTEADAQNISNISSIVSMVPQDFTKQIDPLTNKPYTVEQNVKRYFSDLNNKEAFIDKVSPLIDQHLKFTSDPDLKQTDPRRYDIIQEVAAQSMFENLIKDDNYLKFTNEVRKLYPDQTLSRDELLSMSVGITPKKLEKYRRERYSSLETELRRKSGLGALFNPQTYTNIFKRVGDDLEEEGQLNLFKNLKPEDLSTPQLNEILETLNLRSMVVPAFDKGISQARQAPDRYLNIVNSKRYEALRQSMITEVIPSLAKEIDNKIAFKKYGLQSYLSEGVMDDLRDDFTDNPAVGINFSKRAAALSLRLKSDKQFALALYNQAKGDPNKTREFLTNLNNDVFRNKFSALLVLKAGTHDPGMFSDYEFIGADTPLAASGLGSIDDFDRNFKTEMGYNPAQAADLLDPILTPMFNLKTGEPTSDYIKLSQTGKDNAYWMMVQQILNAPNRKESEKLQALEEFNETTPNPLNLPILEYVETKQMQEAEQAVEEAPEGTIAAEFFRVDPRSKARREAEIKAKQPGQRRREALVEEVLTELETIPLRPSAGSPFTTTKSEQKQAREDFNRAESVKAVLKQKYGIDVARVTSNIGPDRRNLSNLIRNNPSISSEILTLISEYNSGQEIDVQNYLESEIVESSIPQVTEDDLMQTKKVGKTVGKKAIDAVVDIQQTGSEEYKQNTKDFLEDVLVAESNYGLNKRTFDSKRDAVGMFQIIPSQSLAEVKRRLDPKSGVGAPIRKYNELLKENYNIDLSLVTKEDLEKPLVAAAVARAYFMTVDAPIPVDPEERSEYYVDNYVQYDPTSPTYEKDREEAKQNFLINNGYLGSALTQGVSSLLGR